MVSVTRSVFGELPSGAGTVEKFRLQSDQLGVDLLSWGCTISALEVKDRQGRASDVVLGFAELEGGLHSAPVAGAPQAHPARGREGAAPGAGTEGKGPSLGRAGPECWRPAHSLCCIQCSEKDRMNSDRTWPLVIHSGFASIDLKSQWRVRENSSNPGAIFEPPGFCQS